MAEACYKLACSAIAYVSSANPGGNTQIAQKQEVTLNTADAERLYYAFASFPSSLSHKKLIRAVLMTEYIAGPYRTPTAGAYGAAAAFNPSTITWNSKPADVYAMYQKISYSYNYLSSEAGTPYNTSARAKAWIKYGLAITRDSRSSDALAVRNYYEESNTQKNVELWVYYDDGAGIAGKIVLTDSQTSGYFNPRSAKTFKWTYESADATAVCYGDFSQSSAVFYWRQGTSGAWTAVNISGSTKQVTIPANTFPTGQTIQYYVSGTDTDGNTSTTATYTLSTAAGTASANCVSPINSVEDGSAPIQFQWTLSSTDGQQPSRIRSSWRKASDPDDDQYWHNLFDTTTISNSYTAPAGTFPAGGIRWNIRVWNIDGTEGNRDFAEFICVAAPDPVEGLSATSVPWTRISWQSGEQQAYEISIDGEVVKKAFGADVYSWGVPEPLEDGQHTISVRVQGGYGFWSQPSSITIDVENVTPSFWEDIELSGRFDVDAQLSLISPGSGIATPTYIQWFRDGERIASVYYGTEYGSGPFSFADRKALGTHEYYAELWQSSTGNYARSNTVTGTTQSCVKRIRALDDRNGDWLELRLSENSNGMENFQLSQQNVTQHVNGAAWPELERSPFRDRTANYDCAFRCPNEAAAFEALFGKIVILKSRDDEVVIGMLDKVQKKVNAFYISYTFAIQQIHTETFERYTA